MFDGPQEKVDLDKEALEFFFNSVDEHFVILNKDGAVCRANGAFRRFVAPAAGADSVKLSAYLSEESRDRFQKQLASLEPFETITELKLTMRIGWSIRLVQASISRSASDRYYYSAVDITNEARLEQRRKETDDALIQMELLVGIGRWTISKSKPAFWSPGMFRMFGMEENSKPLKFDEYAQMMSPADLKKLSNAFSKSQFHSITQTVTCTIDCPDGQTRVIEFAGSPCYTEDGSIDGISGVALNKTSNIKALQSSMKTESSAKAFLDHASVGVAIIDLDGKISLVNQSLVDMIGKSDVHLLGGKITQLWAQTPEKLQQSVDAAITGETTEFKHVTIERSAETQWIDWICAPWMEQDGSVCGAICIVKDVTEIVIQKRQTEASLARMEYGLALSSMMVWEIDLLQKTVKIEGDWTPFFKSKPSLSQLTNSLFRLAHPDDQPRVSKAWKHHLSAGAPVHLSYRKENAVGREIWVSVASRQDADETGKPVRMIGSMRDITVSQKTDYMTEDLEERLQQKYRRKASLIGDVGRSVSEQIASMLELSHALQRTSLSREQVNMLKLMDTSVEGVSDAIHNIDKYMSIYSHKFENKSSEFNIKELVENCIANSKCGAVSTTIEAVYCDESDDIYKGNPAKIEESLSLFILELQKTVRNDDHVVVEVEVDNSGEGLCILTFDVKHAYPKMPYSDSVLIQLDNPEEEGLSMAIIHDFTEKLKGTVFYEKAGESVSRILTEFPIMKDFERGSSGGSVPKISSQSELSILVAEDNPLNRRVLELLAVQLQLDVTFVENGEEAIDAVKNQAFDVVIMDTQMPILSGISAIRTIRGWERETSREPLQIIAAIPHMSFAKVREAMSVGANDCIAKPISQEDLITQLNDLTGGGWEVSTKKITATG